MSLKESLEAKELLDSYAEITTFFPERYSKKTVDTSLANGLSVHIKTMTDMDKHVVKSFKKDGLVHRKHYRDSLAFVEIKKDKSIVFQQQLNKSFFTLNSAANSSFLKEAVLQGIWLNQQESLNTKTTVFDIVFIKPSDKKRLIYKFLVSNNGEYTLKPQNTQII